MTEEAGKGVPAGLGCRRGGSHSKATAVVYISVLISPGKKGKLL